MNPTRTEAIASFLHQKTHPDLAVLYNIGQEMQCNVSADGGEPIVGEYQGRIWRGFSDGINSWKPFRIPWNASSEPTYTDSIMSYDLVRHAEGIGMTGWNWMEKRSKWVAYDFDAITGHSDKHARKCSDQELDDIREALKSIPWITLRYSTSGSGLHVYVFLAETNTPDAGVPCQTHTEHAALARSILGMLSAMTGFDFTTKVDICGGNMWVWHRKMVGTRGLQAIKQGGVLTDVPPNWREHVKVVSGKRRKTIPSFVPGDDGEDNSFDQMSGQRTRIALDSDHRRLITFLQERSQELRGGSHVWWWDSDHGMLVTHTLLLKDAHEELKLRGVFETSSKGGSAQNCFLFPIRRGGWTVRRYSPGVAEHPSWTQDGAGYTRAFFNCDPNLADISRAHGANELAKGGFAFSEFGVAAEAMKHLGAEMDLPTPLIMRRTVVKPHKDGRLLVEVQKEAKDHINGEKYPGWEAEAKTWTKIFNIRTSSPNDLTEVGDHDDVVRHVVTEDATDCGWALKVGNVWVEEPLTHIKYALSVLGHKPPEVSSIIGSSVMKNWTLQSLPFEPEYPGDRQWNRRAPQLKYAPTLDIDNLNYPTWTKILKHLGKGLDEAVKNHKWCEVNGVLSGADYLKLWIASLFQFPLEPLPYLFFYGGENCGKSTFHEAISLLVTHGVVRGDGALLNAFNGELEGAFLAVIEEVNLSDSKNKLALNRIKDWLLASKIPIHRKNQTPYDARNTSHWIQCANDHRYCPIHLGDTRIVMAYVPPLPYTEITPRRMLFPTLQKEAPDFLGSILSIQIPESPDRLRLPIVETEIKRVTARANRSDLQHFLSNNCHHAPGYHLQFREFYTRFTESLDSLERHDWSKIRVSKELPPEYPTGKINNETCIGNLSWSAPTEERQLLIERNDQLGHPYGRGGV